MKKHIHIVTFRGCGIDSYNNLLRFLSNNKITYKIENTYSETRDDAGLLKYYDRIIFEYDKYIQYRTNRKIITRKQFLTLIKND